MKFILILLITLPVYAGIPVDVVFDIDLTIVALVKDGPGGDFLADPSDPKKNIVPVTFELEGNVHSEKYRLFEGVTDLMEKLKQDPRVRVSFFSGGTEQRNEALLRKIFLPDGSSLWDLAAGRVYGRSSMTPTGVPLPARVRERVKKDLHKVNPDISDVIIVDDIKEFVPESQRAHLLWIGEDFPFPDRTQNPPTAVDPDVFAREKYKYGWIGQRIEEALEQKFTNGVPLSATIGKVTETPFTAPSLVGPRCSPHLILDRLLLQ